MLLSQHARVRACQRGIRLTAIEATLDYGFIISQRGSVIYHLGKRSVKNAALEGLDIREHRNTVVIVGSNGVIITVYKDAEIRHLRAH